MVSIVVPVYKVEQYLCECIDSILAQTYQDIQVILVDDGSPDTCGIICDDYAKSDNRVLVLHKENGGVSSARNHGLKYATGEFVTFCDSDDMYLPNWIEDLVFFMEKFEADVALGDIRKVTEAGELISYSKHETGIVNMNLPEEKIKYCFDKLLTEKHAWEVTSRLFKTEIIRRNSLIFCESCENFGEDLGFTLSYSVFANRVISIESSGYLYRMRNGSMMHSSVDKPRLNATNEIFLSFVPVCRKAFSKKIVEEVLPLFHFRIMCDQYIAVIKYGEYHKMSNAVDQICQKDEWEKWAKTLRKSKSIIESIYGKYDAQRILLLNHFCLHRNSFLFRVERRLFYMLNNRMTDCYGEDG